MTETYRERLIPTSCVIVSTFIELIDKVGIHRVSLLDLHGERSLRVSPVQISSWGQSAKQERKLELALGQ